MIEVSSFREAIDMLNVFENEMSNSDIVPISINIYLNFDRKTQDGTGLYNQNERKNITEIEITDLIRSIGVPANIMGYHYLRDAIMTCVSNKDVLAKITKTLYPSIASKYRTTSSRAERAIRHAIEVAWKKGDMDRIQEVFGYSQRSGNNRPTNSEFIAVIVDKLLVG